MKDMSRHKAIKAFSLIIAIQLFLAILPISPTASYAVSEDVPSEWAVEEVQKAREYGLIPAGMYHSFIDNVSRLEFCRLVMALYTKITGIPEKTDLQSVFIDTYNMSIINAYELGIVKGVGGGYFLPGTSITRQEIAVMLFNAITAINSASGKDILGNFSAAQVFLDRDQTAEWAVEAINTLRSNDIMLGDGRNRFNPLDNTTKEMAFILVNRIYLIYSGLDAKKAFPAAYTGEILMRIKASLASGGEFQIIGDVYEPYPGFSIDDISNYLDGAAFIDNNGALYYIDKSESLSESVAAGYAGGQYYPVYVLSRDGLPGGSSAGKLYLIKVGDQYKVFVDAKQREPYFQKTFSDVLFPTPGDTAVIFAGPGSGDAWMEIRSSGNYQGAAASGGSSSASADIAQSDFTLTFSEMRQDMPEQIDAFFWLVQLARGSVTRLIALEF